MEYYDSLLVSFYPSEFEYEFEIVVETEFEFQFKSEFETEIDFESEVWNWNWNYWELSRIQGGRRVTHRLTWCALIRLVVGCSRQADVS